MIKENEVYVKIGSWNHKHYKDLGYENVKKGNLVMVKVEDLTLSSHTKITAICEICGNEKVLLYKTYNENKKRTGQYNCNKCCYDVMKVSLKKKYGVENVSFIPEIKEKIKIKNIENSDDRFIKRTKTNLERYGVENTFQSEELMKDSIIKARITNIKNGTWYSYNNEWQKYKIEVLCLTRKNKKKLFLEWNGYDYYDNEYIKNNFNLIHSDPNYPNVDHKVSIRYGFDNNISIEEIANIDNLCITKKKLNASKYTRTEEQFKEFFY